MAVGNNKWRSSACSCQAALGRPRQVTRRGRLHAVEEFVSDRSRRSGGRDDQMGSGTNVSPRSMTQSVCPGPAVLPPASRHGRMYVSLTWAAIRRSTVCAVPRAGWPGRCTRVLRIRGNGIACMGWTRLPVGAVGNPGRGEPTTVSGHTVATVRTTATRMFRGTSPRSHWTGRLGAFPLGLEPQVQLPTLHDADRQGSGPENTGVVSFEEAASDQAPHEAHPLLLRQARSRTDQHQQQRVGQHTGV